MATTHSKTGGADQIEIIALCAESNYCLELMSAYAVTVIVGIVGLTMLLIVGYQRYEKAIEQYTPYLPAFSAAVLIVMGVGFIIGAFSPIYSIRTLTIG